jgi:type II secretory pathway component GspD/PulD (secretin)
LEAAGVDRTTPVTARLRDVKFGKALSVLLDSVGGGNIELGYKVDQGVITISTVADLDRDTVTRVYDIRDLMITIPDFQPPPDLLGIRGPDKAARDDAGNAKGPDADAAGALAGERVIRLIRDTIAADTWDKTSKMRELQGQLIVTATPKVHEQIVPLLAQLRDARAWQVSVEARFLSVDDNLLNDLPAKLREAVAGQLRGAKDLVPVDAGPSSAVKPPATGPAPVPADPSKVVILDAAQTDALLKAVQTNWSNRILTAPRLTLFNGQTAYVMVSTQQAYVADLSVVKEKDGATRYEPVIGTAQAGVLLWAGATVSADRKSATLTLRPRLTQLAAIEEVPWHANPPGEHLTVQRPRILASELATIVNVPDRSTLLLGGLKSYDAAEGQPAEAGKPHNVLLLVRPTLIIQREVQGPQFPLLEKKGKGEGGK